MAANDRWAVNRGDQITDLTVLEATQELIHVSYFYTIKCHTLI